MSVSRFKPSEPLIFVKGYVWGAHDRRELKLVFDPGATQTIVRPEILDDLGYNPRQGERITKTRSVVGQESGYLIRVVRLAALRFEFSNFRVNALDLPGDYDFQYDGQRPDPGGAIGAMTWHNRAWSVNRPATRLATANRRAPTTTS